MKKIRLLFILMFLFKGITAAQDGLIPRFDIKSNEIALHKQARQGNPFDQIGRRFAVLGEEGGSFEAWAYPLKLLRGCRLSFFLGDSTRPIESGDIVKHVDVTPEAVTLTFTYQSFMIKAIYITSIEQAGAVILLQVDSDLPISIVCGFFPVLQPMWPAGLGGQFAYWDNNIKAYIISESTGRNHGMIGSPAASGMSYTPAHMLSDSPSEFRIEIPDPQKVLHSFVPVVMAGGAGKRDDVIAIYREILKDPEALYQKRREHFLELTEQTLKIRTPVPEMNLAFEWAKVSFDNLMVDNPSLGMGMVAGWGASGTSGRPGFGWFFGGDAFINSLSQSGYGDFASVRKSLEFTLKWQREDGKMSHELSQAHGYVDWWKDYHYGYIHGDTTPYFLCALYDYVRMSGDGSFIRNHWQEIKLAYQWCLSTDANGDGLMDNRKAGLGALEYGELTGIETDIYLAAVWVRAAYSMQSLAEVAGESRLAEKSEQDYLKAKSAFNRLFWNEARQFYAYAFNADGKHVEEISPWSAVGLMWGHGEPERSRKALERLCASDIMTDWGIRSISNRSRYFQPLNYNYGAVWPFLSSWVTTALFKHYMPHQGYSLLAQTGALTFEHQLGGVTEVFSGSRFVWPQEAVAHQGFSSAGVSLPFIRGLCGLEGNALDGSVEFAPQFPANWRNVAIDNYRIGESRLRFNFLRDTDRIRIEINSLKGEGLELILSPVLAGGNRIRSVLLDGKPQELKFRKTTQTIIPELKFPVKVSNHEVEWRFDPTLEIIPPTPQSRVGDRNAGIKIISVEHNLSHMNLIVEGVSGKTYSLEILNPKIISDIQGAKVEHNSLMIEIPQAAETQFQRHTVQIDFKK